MPDPAPAGGYQVQYRLGSGTWMPPDPGQAVAAGTNTHVFTGLAVGMYHARVRSVGAGNLTSTWVETSSPVMVTADMTAPTLNTAVVNGNMLTLTYDEALDEGSVPSGSGGFTLGGTSETVSMVAISDRTVTLTLSAAVTSGDSVTLTYTPGANPVQDAAGNDAAALSTQAVTNNTPPMLVRTGNRRPGVGGILLRLRYDDALDESSVPDAGDFTLGGTMPTVSEVDISGRDVLLTLSAPVSSTDVVTVTYMPGTNPVQDEDGNDVAAFTDVSVLNVTPPVPAGSVTASSPDLGELEVSWTEPADINAVGIYQVQYRIDGGTWLPATPVRVNAVTADGTLTHTFTGLAAGMYHARVRSLGTGTTNFSTWVETSSAVQVDAGLVLPAPTNLVYTVGVAIAPPVTLPQASGGTGAITYALTGPNGMNLNEVPGLMFDPDTRVLSGTLTTDDSTTLTYTATDSASPTPAMATRTFTITVNRGLTLPAPSNLTYTVNTAITPLTLPAATNGVGTISYTLTGTLPAGLAFNAGTRVLSGTPSTVTPAGSPPTLTYTATDMDTPPVVRTQTFTITVSTGLAFPTQDDLAYTVGTAIDPVTLPQATNGTGTITYALTGTLPAGLAFNAGTRVLSGTTPSTVSGPTTLTYTATDSATTPTMATQMFTITINAALALDLTTLTVPDYGAGTAITPLTLPAATGGTVPISYTLTGPSASPLPAGLTFNATTRVLSGTPTALGTTTLTYTATDDSTTPVEVMDTFDVTVLPVVTITRRTSPVTEGTDATFTVTATPAPTAALTVNVNVTESGMFMGTAPTSLTVGTSGSGTLTVPTDDDSTDEGSGSITATLAAGTGYIVGSQSSAVVTVNDNDGPDEPAVSISAAPTTVTEGTPARFTVTATPAPTTALTVNVSVTQTGMFIDGTAPPSLTVGTSGRATLMVATENDDTAEMNGSIEVTVTGGPGYMVAMAPGNSATVTVEDDDDAGITVTPTSLTTTEAPGASRTATFTVVLDTPPTANVVIGVSSSNTDEGTVSPMSLTFTPGMTGVTGDWNRAQTVTVTGVDDMETDGDRAYTITLSVVPGADSSYNAVPSVSVSVTNTDDEEPSQEEQDAALEDTLTTTLAGTGRLTVVAAVDVLGARFQQRVAGAGRRQSLTLAGQAVELDDLRAAGERQLAVALRDWGSVTLEDLMSDSAFELALSGDSAGGGDGFVLWGQGDWLDFNSKPQDTFSMDGNVLSGHIGVDYQRGGLLLGLALGHSSGEVDYVDSVAGSRSRGTVDSELLSVYPYIHYSPDGTGVGSGLGDGGLWRGRGGGEAGGAGQPAQDGYRDAHVRVGSAHGRVCRGRRGPCAEGRWLLRADGVGRGGYPAVGGQ